MSKSLIGVLIAIATLTGCTAYRFYDNGRAIYYTSCKGATDSTYNSGKNVLHQQVTTDIK